MTSCNDFLLDVPFYDFLLDVPCCLIHLDSGVEVCHKVDGQTLDQFSRFCSFYITAD